MKRFVITAKGWHFYVMSKTDGKVWLVTTVANPGTPVQVVAIEGTYAADETGTYKFTATQREYNGRQRETVKGIAGPTNVNKALDVLQDRMDGVYSLAGEEWQRL